MSRQAINIDMFVTYIDLTSHTVAVCIITLVLIKQVMNSKLVTGHGTTYGLY